MGKVVRKIGPKLLSEEAKIRVLLRHRQFECWNLQSAINTPAIMVDRAHAMWTNGHITGVLFMDMKAAFPSMAKGRVVNMMKVR